MEIKQIAFWEYAGYPYLLSGEISQFSSDGKKVETVNFGKGYWFTPIAILPEQVAKLIQDKLEELKDLKKQEEKNLKDKFENLLEDQIPTYLQIKNY